MIYYMSAYTTLISAALGVCFSIRAIITEKESSWTNALYMFARSLALMCGALVPICINAPTTLRECPKGILPYHLPL